MASRVATIFNAILYKRLILLRKNSSKLGFYAMLLQVYTSTSFAIIPIDEVCVIRTEFDICNGNSDY